MALTRLSDFLSAYRAVLIDAYEWARDPEDLANYMENVERTIEGSPGTQPDWLCQGTNVRRAWHAAGGKGNPNIKILRGLPK